MPVQIHNELPGPATQMDLDKDDDNELRELLMEHGLNLNDIDENLLDFLDENEL